MVTDGRSLGCLLVQCIRVAATHIPQKEAHQCVLLYGGMSMLLVTGSVLMNTYVLAMVIYCQNMFIREKISDELDLLERSQQQLPHEMEVR